MDMHMHIYVLFKCLFQYKSKATSARIHMWWHKDKTSEKDYKFVIFIFIPKLLLEDNLKIYAELSWEKLDRNQVITRDEFWNDKWELLSNKDDSKNKNKFEMEHCKKRFIQYDKGLWRL